jgi:transcriptional regulator with XRE-family HTH domain
VSLSTEGELKKFGANVRRERSAINMSQQKFAELADLNIRTVQRIEKGERNLLLPTILRIRRALKCPWDNLLGR